MHWFSWAGIFVAVCVVCFFRAVFPKGLNELLLTKMTAGFASICQKRIVLSFLGNARVCRFGEVERHLSMNSFVAASWIGTVPMWWLSLHFVSLLGPLRGTRCKMNTVDLYNVLSLLVALEASRLEFCLWFQVLTSLELYFYKFSMLSLLPIIINFRDCSAITIVIKLF